MDAGLRAVDLLPGQRLKVMFSDAIVECEVISNEIKNNAI